MNIQSVKQRFGIIGRSPKLERALETAVRVAQTDLSVLIQGESGVGKEIFSRIIHETSLRKHNNFIAINCGAMPSGTINSELFGHEKGSFTGAISERKGYFEAVDGGTIFLDEIGEMPLDTQAYLLRVLESGEFLRVGSSKILSSNVRVIAATNVDLHDNIQKGKFREDLYYRLNTVPIKVPALHERQEDIYMLFRKFAGDFAERYRIDSLVLTPDAKLILENYYWPGNIRELKNLVEHLSVMSDSREIDAETLLEIAPQLRQRFLPSKGNIESTTNTNFQEREIFYKFLLDMKSDLNDVKSLIYELVNVNNLTLPDLSRLKNVQNIAHDTAFINSQIDLGNLYQSNINSEINNETKPIILNQSKADKYNHSEEIDEIVTIEEMEKKMIKKALKKYNNRRKDAAEELGISERTLYRKIKEYNFPE